MPSKAKPKAKGASRASKPRKFSTKSKSPAKAGAKIKPGAEAKRGTGNAASRLIDERIRSLGGWRAYRQAVKLTFARGASLEDPRGLFNSSLEGNTRRAIDIREGEVLDAKAFKALIRAAVAENLRSSAR
jgi:hypothetical protein